MKTIETRATVGTDGILTARVPPEVPPGDHRVVLMIEERPTPGGEASSLDLPIIHVSRWPGGLSLRREEIYGDWER